MNTARLALTLLVLCLLGLAGCSIGGKSSPSRFYVLSPIPEGSDRIGLFWSMGRS